MWLFSAPVRANLHSRFLLSCSSRTGRQRQPGGGSDVLHQCVFLWSHHSGVVGLAGVMNVDFAVHIPLPAMCLHAQEKKKVTELLLAGLADA